MRITKLLFKTLLLSLVFVSCGEDSIEEIIDQELPIIDGKISFKNGILISGEGSGAGSGSVSFLSEDFTVLSNQIYYSINNEQLGTFLQSLAFDEERAFISVDNAATITVVERESFVEIAKIQEGLNHPRYMTVVDGIGYSTNWGSTSSESDDFIAVIDLENYVVTETIAVGNGPERIVSKNGKLYVSHKGAFTTNNVVTVIDIESKSTLEITVKDNPDELYFDSEGNLVVLSEGRTLYDINWSVTGHTLAAISKIDVSTETVISEVVFPDTKHPSALVIDENKFYYYVSSSIYKMDASATTLPESSFLESGYIYNFNIKNNQLFTLSASFTKLSELSVYDLSTKEETNSFNVALGASKIYFN
jgi:hypothetical protein